MAQIRLLSPELEEELAETIRAITISTLEELKEKAKETSPRAAMTRQQVLKYLGIGDEKLKHWEALGLKSVNIDGHVIYTKELIREFFKEFEQ